MRWWSELKYLVRKLNRRRAELEAEEEIQNHLDLEARERLEAGFGPEEARYAARRAFGSVALAREQSRAMWGFGTLEQWWQDLRYGSRMLLKRPGFTLTAILTLTLGIGANTAIFSVVHAVLLQSLPYPDPDRIVMVWEMRRPDVKMQNVINVGNFYDWKEQNQVFEDMAMFNDRSVNLTGSGEPERIKSQAATTGFFNILGVPPILGRSFAPDDGMPGRSNVVVIGFGLWQRRFGGDPQIIGRKLILDGSENTVIGVMPAGFSWSVKGGGKAAEIWSPLQVQERSRRGRGPMAVARIKSGVTLEQAKAEINAIHSRIEQQYPEFNAGWGVNLVPLREQYTGEIRLALLVLVGAVGMVLLIACANVANLLLSRAAGRQREVAVRAALGASRGRIIRQMLTESLLIAGLGGGAGLALAWWGTDMLVSLAPPDLLNLSGVKINAVVLGFTMGISLLTGVIFGLAPALEATRLNLGESLKEGGKGSGGGMRAHRLRNSLVIFEVALALVLLVGAGLLIRSFSRLNAVDPGFNPQNVLTMGVSLPGLKYNNIQKRGAFLRQAVEQMQALPGVESVGVVNALPFASSHSGTSVDVEGRPIVPVTQKLKTGVIVTDVNYFRAIGIPLKRGRFFTDQEVAETRHVVIINEMFAQKHFPNEDPLGKRVTIFMKDEEQPCEIIGIVGDSKHNKLDSNVRPMAYWPYPELPFSGMTFVIRTLGGAAPIASSARNLIRALEPDLPFPEVRTMESLIGTSMARERFNTLLLAVFAVVALLLAGVGIYGVMAYSVAQQKHDIGVRMALGARKSDVLQLVVRKGMTLALCGVAIGVAASFALTRVIKTLLYNVSVTDPATFGGIALLLTAVAMFACYIPARRATKVDPMVALRYE